MKKLQFTYFNHTNKHVSVYRGSLQDYVGYFEPQSMVSFEFPIEDNQAIFIKQWADQTLLVMAVDKQTGTTPKPILCQEKFTDPDYIGGGEP